MKRNALIIGVPCAMALNIRRTPRWKGTGYWRARKVSEDTLKVWMEESTPVELTSQERNRRLYNRNW